MTETEDAAKKALLVGSSFSAAPMFFELKRRGLHVTVCGGKRDDPCHQYADDSIYIDYSDKEALLDAVQQNNFDFLVPSCNDYSYISAGWVADRLSFPGYDSLHTIDVIHTKKSFRDYSQSIGLKAPKSFDGSRATSAPSFPCLVKPVDSSSGRGVTVVHRSADLSDAIQAAKSSSRRGEYVVEEFVAGTLHSHSAFISQGQIALDFFVDEFCTVYPYQVNCSNHPSSLDESLRTGVRREIEKLASALKLCDGLIHTQFITNGSDFWLVECMRRCPGDLYGTLIERSTGIRYASLFVAPFVGESYSCLGGLPELRPFGRHTISTETKQVNFSFSHEIPATDVEVIQLKLSGNSLDPAPYDKLAILMVEFPNREAMLNITPRFADLVHIHSHGGSRVEP
jgi:formate-dependent phosphoribosylglycinamide formyltransferase (GAR transformylase)